MSHVLGVYWAPGHQRPTDIDYMRQLQPPAIRVLDPDPNQLVIAHNAAPNALILPRDWALSEQHDDVRRDPVGTGKRHAQEWRQKLDRWALPIPANQIVVVGMNELQVWNMLPQAVQYTVAWLTECTRLNLRACALNLSVGWPANSGPGTPPDWTPYAPIEAAIQRGDHFLTLHSYWYKSGPQDGAGWWAWRHRACPWDVPIIIGECGVDLYVDLKRWENDGKPNRGWQGNISPDQYAAQMEAYARGCDRRVVAILPFLTDYRSNTWQNFDTAPAHGALLARKDRMVPQHATQASAPVTTHLPSISSGPTPVQAPAPTQAATMPRLVHPIANPALRRITQPFGPSHTGIDFAAPLGTPIRAVDAGTVIEAGNDPTGYGLYVKLRHTWGESLYAHLSQRHVGPDQPNIPIDAGIPIGLSGNTGNSTGPHLHFAIRVYPYQRTPPFDGFSDPLPFLTGQDLQSTPAPSPAPQPTIDKKEMVKAITLAALEFDVDPDLLLSQAWAESSFDPRAVSSAGAKGLLQIMDATWAEWSPKIGAGNDPLDALQNARVGARYMHWLLAQTNGNVYDALIAYGWGIGNWMGDAIVPAVWSEYSRKIVHGRDLLKAVGA